MTQCTKEHPRRQAATPLLDDALALAARGRRVLPIRPGGKEPITRHGVHDASKSPDVIRGWWKRSPDANVAVACGADSGVLVLDVDPRNGGDKTMVAFADQHGPLPPSPTVRTGGGGLHLYFQHPSGDVRFRKTLGEGVDIQGSGRYVLAPHSVHPSGSRYRWEVSPDDIALPDLPEAWLQQITKPPPLHPPDPTPTTHTQCVTGEIEPYVGGSIQATLPPGPGTRHECLLRFLRRLKRHAQLAAKPAREIRPHVLAWYRQALPTIGTRDFVETWSEAVAAWRKTDPTKETFWAIVAAGLQEEPPALVNERHYDEPETIKLILVCRALQRHHGDRPFFLGCREAAEAIGTDRTTASRRMKMLDTDGVIKLVSKGTRGKAGAPGEASEWRYLGD